MFSKPMTAGAVHLVCPHCLTVNRILPSNLTQNPGCGHCHASLFHGHPIELDESVFDRHLQRNQIPMLVDFWAPWCGPCRQMTPWLAEATLQLEPRVRVAKVDTEANPHLSLRYDVRSIPTLILFNKGQEIARKIGTAGPAEIAQWAFAHTTSQPNA